MKKQLLISTAILLFLALGTLLVVSYGRGYRFGFDDGKLELSGTGLLVTTSNPDGAQVFINNKLSTATDDTINLFPGEYTVKIVKEGYFPWEKKIKVQKEIVAKADARLFPIAPKLESITASGVQNPVIDPSFTQLAYTIASASAEKNGIYVLDMTSRPILTLQSASTQLIDDSSDVFSSARLAWSPDGRELVATLSGSLANPTTYLLTASGFNSNPQDVSATLSSVDDAWKKELAEVDRARKVALKKPVQKLVNDHMNIIAWSPDDTRILYAASNSATLSIAIKPRLVGIDSTPEVRTIEKDKLYVYDIKEDKNYLLPISNNQLLIPNEKADPLRNSTLELRNLQGDIALSWMPDSSHLLHVHDKRIDIMDFDGTNITTIYAGPFMDNYVFPWPDGSKIVILTNLGNPTISSNLYTIDLE